MSEKNESDSSTSESEVSACSSSFNSLKALYSNKTKIPVETAPLFENIVQYEAAQKMDIIPVGHKELVKKREEEKEQKRLKEERALQEKNKQRFARFESMVTTKRQQWRVKNVLTRIENMDGPLAVLKDCVDQRLRIKVITRNERGIRGYLQATLVAFDKQWNLALSDVLEVWKRKGVNKRKIPPGLGTSVPKGTAASISAVPVVTEIPLGKGVYQCTRHIPQLMVRGEHVVLVNVVER